MAKCPHCQAEISSLLVHETKTIDAIVELIYGNLQYSDEEVNIDDRGYSCPKCDEDICTGDSEAESFLKGGE